MNIPVEIQNKRVRMWCFELRLNGLNSCVFCRSRLLKHVHKARLISVFLFYFMQFLKHAQAQAFHNNAFQIETKFDAR